MKTPSNTPPQFRQGDVLLIRIPSVPAALRSVRPRCGAIVLADGEMTGHAHKIPAMAGALFETHAGERFLQITQPTRLTHEEHGEIDLEPGAYAVVRQREYAPEGEFTVGD